jgi:hypothetical protein
MHNTSNQMNYNNLIRINGESSQSKLPIKQFYPQNIFGSHQHPQQNNHQVYLKPSPQ